MASSRVLHGSWYPSQGPTSKQVMTMVSYTGELVHQRPDIRNEAAIRLVGWGEGGDCRARRGVLRITWRDLA